MRFTKKLIIVSKNLLGISSLEDKIRVLEKRLEETKHISVLSAKRAINSRLELKALNNEVINVVFICHRPVVWESLHSVYEALNNDKAFNVTIVAIPNKKQLPELGFRHEVYESEGAENFWKDYGCINGYNYETKEWFDLKKLNPDYVFFQQPYNVTRCEAYKSWNVAQYAKICYLNYFSPVNFGELYDECTPIDFLSDISFYFTQNITDHKFILNRYKKIDVNDTKCIMTGYPRYDQIQQIKGSSLIWSDKKHEKFRLVWTPRWTTNEGNCHFFEFKDKLISFCDNNDIELVFRPHPQAFLEWNATGEFTLHQQNELRKIFDCNERLHLDESDNYLDMFYSSDCLLSDLSSVMYDYFLTGQPIIYSMGNSEYDKADLLDEGLYKVKTWEQVEEVLRNLLAGKDTLAEKRKKVIKDRYYINKHGAGNEIHSIIKHDAKDYGIRSGS